MARKDSAVLVLAGVLLCVGACKEAKDHQRGREEGRRGSLKESPAARNLSTASSDGLLQTPKKGTVPPSTERTPTVVQDRGITGRKTKRARREVLGWHKARWGMTEAQLGSFYPSMVCERESCELRDVEVAGLKATVSFRFDGRALVLVTIYFSTAPNESEDLYASEFRKLRTLLYGEYGEPEEDTIRDGVRKVIPTAGAGLGGETKQARFETCKWFGLEKADISLVRMDLGGEFPQLMLGLRNREWERRRLGR